MIVRGGAVAMTMMIEEHDKVDVKQFEELGL